MARPAERCCRLIAVCLAVCLTAAAASDSATPAREGTSLATFACDITPPEGHPLCGGWIKPLEGVDDPELAKGVVLRDPGGTYVLCVVDWCELRNDAYDLFRRAIAEAAETTPDRVALTCLHAHNAPITDRHAQELLDQEASAPLHADLAFLETAAARIAEAIRAAHSRRVTHVGTSAARVERVASNRRVPGPNGSIRVRYSSTKDASLHEAPEGLVDPWLRTVSFFDGGQPLAHLHYYATHPQSYYGDGRATCDFPGIARERLEKETAVFQLHFTGCAGDVTAGKYNDGTPPRRVELAERMYHAMRQSIEIVERVPVSRIGWTARPVWFPLRTEPEQAFGYNAEQLKNTEAKAIDRLNAALKLAWIERCRANRPVDVSCLSLGSIRLLLLPGEPFVRFQLEAQRRRPELFVATAGYADCGMGYICTEASFREGGYEPTASSIAPASEHYFRNAIEDLIDEPEPGRRPVLANVARIWDAAPHNAFTDLVRFRGGWYVTFREGAGHVSDEAGIRVLTSADGVSWQSAALLAEKGVDLRDPKLSITPDGRLMLLGGWRSSLPQPGSAVGAQPPRRANRFGTWVAFSKDGTNWTAPKRVLTEGLWLWRVTWHDDLAYGVAYACSDPDRSTWQSRLYRSRDGITYEKVTDFTEYPGLTEATIRFEEDGTAHCLHRRDGGTRTALAGTSRPPYTTWTWRDTGFYFGGPEVVWHDGAWWGAGRWMVGSPQTVLARVDWRCGLLEPAAFLPSGGDTSYPGLVSHEGALWMSYYASHEGKTAIYLARFEFE